jgi:hypothetical protein
MDLARYYDLLSGESTPPHSYISHGTRYRSYHYKTDLLDMRQSEQLFSVRSSFGGFDDVLPEAGSGEDVRFPESISSLVEIG